MSDLADQARAAAREAAGLPSSQRAPRVVLRVGFRNYHRDRAKARASFESLGFSSAGSQILDGAPFALECGMDAALQALVIFLERRRGLTSLTSLDLARPVLRLPAIASSDGRFEAVLHPRLDAAPETALARFAAFAASLGGEVRPAYARLVDGLIFVPVHLPPERAGGLAAYQPLRILRPMGSVGLREETA